MTAPPHQCLAFLREQYVGLIERRTAYWLAERYDKPELRGATLWLITSRKSRGGRRAY